MLKEFRDRFEAAINDDLNVPLALGVLWSLVKLPKSKDVYDLALSFDKVFALDLNKVSQPAQSQTDVPEDVRLLAERRLAARKEKNWSESDRLRAEISQLGFAVRDTADGYELSKK